MASKTSTVSRVVLGLFGIACGALTTAAISRATTSAAPTGSAPVEGLRVGSGSTDTAAKSWLTPPVTAAVIAVPMGAKLAMHLRGVGVQIYACAGPDAGATGSTATAPGYAWTLTAPEAKLFDGSGSEVGVHTKGPTWTSSRDGSAMVATKVAQVDAPIGKAIPWLALRATTHTGAGTFSPVTFVQRVNTVGGKAPEASTCNSKALSAQARVDYSADYFFFEGGTPPKPR